MKVIDLLFILLCMSACNTNKVRSIESLNDSISLEPHAVILLQPYDDFSQEDAIELSYKLLKRLNDTYCGQWKIKVLQNKSLPNKAYYKPRNRYLANELLKDLPNTSS